MRAIILAAGLGSRLGEYTTERPKGMVQFFGEPLIGHQLNVLRSAGITDIVIVRGYRAEKIDFAGVRYYHNPDYATTNMVATLFSAMPELVGDVIVLYADILYEPRVIEAVIKSKAEIGVVVDTDYQDYWVARVGSITEDSESLAINSAGLIYDIGRSSPDSEHMQARYVGILCFRGDGIHHLKRVYSQQKELHSKRDNRWYNSPSFAKAYMTDLLQCLIDQGKAVSPIKIQRGWLEIDSVTDLTSYQQWRESGKLRDFINIEEILQPVL